MKKLGAKDKLDLVSKDQLKEKSYNFEIGDTVRVHVKISEDGKTRTQMFEGIVIGQKRGGINSAFTVRRISYGEGVERTFPVHSPFVDDVEVIKKGSVKRSKLYYLRSKVGKKAKVAEKIEKA